MIYVLLALLVILQYYDGMTTYRLLSKGGREYNPVVRYAIEKLGLARALITIKGTVVSALVVTTFTNPLPVWVLVGLSVLYMGVVIHNFKELNK